MSSIIAEISRYCTGLNSDRQSERKNSINKLLDRLRNFEVQQALDANNGQKHRKKISWDSVSHSIFRYVVCEADGFKHGCKLTEETANRRKKEISEAFRSFIQIAEKRGPCLKSADIFDHVKEVMCDNKTRQWFYNEYTTTLLKNFLLVKAHMNEMSLKIWHDLVHTYCDCLLNPPARSDATLFAQTLNQLMTIAKDLPHLNGYSLFGFFAEILRKLRHGKSESLIENILSSFNKFSVAVAADSCRQLCILGEDLYPLLLPLWNRSSASVKDELIRFFHLQMQLHYPSYARREDTDLKSANGTFFKNCLLKLYDAITAELHQLVGKIQIAGSRADFALKKCFIALAVDVYHQVFLVQGDAQCSSPQLSDTGSCRKKRKTESRWSVVREGLSNVAHPAACTAWLQVFTLFIETYPESFPLNEYFHFLNSLHQSALACKRPEVKGFILRALCVLADKSDSLIGWNEADDSRRKDVVILWQKVWLDTLKSIHHHQSDQSGFSLLISLIKNDIVIPKQDPFAIFFAVHSEASSESLQFLLVLMQRYPIPQRINHGISFGSSVDQQSKTESRKHLLQLVLPNIDFSVDNKTLWKSLPHISSKSLGTITLILNALMQKNTLILSQDTTKEFSRVRQKSSAIIDELKDFLCEATLEAKNGMVGLLENEEFLKTQNSSNWLIMCTKYASLFCSLLIALKTDLALSNLRNSLAKNTSSLLGCLTDFAIKFYKNSDIDQDERTDAVFTMIEYLDSTLAKLPKDSESSETFLNLFSRRLLNFILGICTDSISSNSSKTVHADPMDLDEFGSLDSGATLMDGFDDLIDSGDPPMSTQKKINSSNHQRAGSPVEKSKHLLLLSSADKLRIASSRLMLKFIFPRKEAQKSPNRKYLPYREEFVEFLERDFEATSTLYRRLLSDIVEHLSSRKVEGRDEVMDLIFELIRKFVSELRNDQEACKTGLGLLCQLIDFIGPDSTISDPALSQIRCIAIKILSAFWKLRTEKYSPEVRMMIIDCFVKLLKNDPKQEWSCLEPLKISKREVSKDEQSMKIPDLLLQLLSDPSHRVRTKAANHVMILFRSPTNLQEPASPGQQMKAFDKVANALTDLVVVKDGVKEEELEDVNANRAWTVLLVIKQITVSSSLCEKKALALLFHDYKEIFLDIQLVGKIFRETAKQKGYADPKEYLKEHLGYLCNDWMKRRFPITEFPSSVVTMSTKEFLRFYSREITPYLMFYCDEMSFDKFKQKLELHDPWSEVLVQNFDKLIVFSLPYVCQSSKLGLEDEAWLAENEGEIKQAKLAFEFLEKKLSKEVIQKLLQEKYDDIVTELLSRMYDPPSEGSDTSHFMRDSDAPPNPPFFTSKVIRRTLEYLSSLYQNKSTLHPLSRKKDSIQSILLSLSTNINAARNDRERVRRLCAYRFFIFFLLDAQDSLGLNRAFFIRDVIHRCSHWLNKDVSKESTDNAFDVVYEVLHKVSKASLTNCYEEFGSHVSTIVNCLTKYAKIENERQPKALQLLRLVINDNNNNSSRKAIADLAPMPNESQFSALTRKINEIKNENEIRDKFEDFSKLCNQNEIPTEVWDYFLEMIRNEKTYLYAYMEVNKDGNLRILGLLSKMLKIAASLKYSLKIDEARGTCIAIAKCLGEIGPINCHALALPLEREEDEGDPDESFFGSNQEAYRHHLVLDRLCQLQTSENIEIAASAAKALKNALHTKAGVTFLNIFDVPQDIPQDTKPEFFLYSEPFKPQRTKKGFQLTQSSQTQSQPLPKPSGIEFLAFAGSENLWSPGLMAFDDWIKELTTVLISTGAVEDEIYAQTASVCQLDVQFAELILPLLVHNILENCSEDFRSSLSSLFNQFLTSYLSKNTQTAVPSNKRYKSIQNDRKSAARMIIKVINYLRKQDKPASSRQNATTKWANNFWLDIKYLELAQVAFDCCSYFAAVMFTEIWCDIQRWESSSSGDSSQDSGTSSQGSQWKAVSNHSGESSERISAQRLLFEAYSNIGEPDGIYGVDTGCSNDVSTRIKAYEHEKEFSKALLTQDLEISNEDLTAQLQLAKNLERSGLQQVMLAYTNGIDKLQLSTSAEFEELRFEAAWRNGLWDFESDSISSFQKKPGFSQNIYSSILALKEGEEHEFGFLMDEARLIVLSDSQITGNVSANVLYQFLSKFNAITQLEEYGQQYFSKSLDLTNNPTTLDNDFQYYELALSLKSAAVKATLTRERSRENVIDSMQDEVTQVVYHQLMRTAVLAREAKKYHICERQLSEIRQLETISQVPSEWKIEEAKMFWDRGEKNMAMQHLKTILRNCEKGKDKRAADYKPAVLGLYGHWLAETRSENPTIIIDNYMELAACLLEESQCTEIESPTEAYYLLARYADSQYKGIQDYIKSSTFENKQSVIKKVKEEIDRLDEMEKSGASSSTRYYRRLVVQRDEDENELQQMIKDRKQFLQKALENYVRCLCCGDTYDLRIFRLCSLWLANGHEQFVNQIMKECISKMQSRKFIPLMYQLAARMGTSSENPLLRVNLEQLIEKAGKEHPYHVLFIVMALCNIEDESIETTGSGRRGKMSRKSQSTNAAANESRIQSAKAVLAKLRKTKAPLIDSMEKAMTAYMELAYYDIQNLKRQTGKFDLPSKLRLRSLRNLQTVAIPTLDIPVDASCEYKRITYICGFDAKFTHCGGINLPKVITCIGSDGKRRRQLVKGRDDLRQDAVMQQVFEMVNKLLKENPETRKRELRIRTYKVVPLSQRSGIVEWCENTVPLGEYLVGNRGVGGAHQRYHPNDWTAMECRKKLTDATLADGKRSKYNVFQDIMNNFRPAFRHFFYEKFTDPSDWFTRRLAYTRSLASSSIVGYVVGLGDRHVQNILVDFNTAELVHIDLGVAFEQGKQLPTPETIPFRLTRDLVDGLGVAGVEGIFRRCCEKTMELMRNSQEAILTIVEVLLYDPLYEWTLSPLKAVQLQQKTTETEISDTFQNTSATGDGNINNLLEALHSAQPQQHNSKNKMAQRVLVRLRQKLDGNEGGCFLSTQGQVNFLIQAARDAKNLCRVFPGWQPWL